MSEILNHFKTVCTLLLCAKGRGLYYSNLHKHVSRLFLSSPGDKVPEI